MPEILWDLLDFLCAAAFVLVVRRLVLMPVRVKGSSMNNTLKSGEFMLCIRLRYRQRMKRGDIVICHYPGRTHRLLRIFTVRTCFVKRLIALPGDVIEIRDGLFYVNGEPSPLPASAASAPRYTRVFSQKNGNPSSLSLVQPEEYETDDAAFRRIGAVDLYTRYRLGDNECFVMGDHRSVSNDCRRIGPISTDLLLGKVTCVFLPFRRTRKL